MKRSDREKQLQEAKKFLSDQGYGAGTNFTLNTVASLMVNWSEEEKPNISASYFLTKRKISLTNSLRAMFRKNPDMYQRGCFSSYEKAMKYGYNLAVRRLKNNSL